MQTRPHPQLIDTASAAAQNSLLKFIEEPINQTPTVGIFLATELSNVVSTIQSRCILQHFKALDIEKRIEILKSNNLDEIDAILTASLTNNIEESIEIVKSSDYMKNKELFLELLKRSKNKEAVMYYLNNVNYFSDSKKLTMLLEWVLLFLEDVNRLSGGSDNLILMPLYDKIKEYDNKYKNQKKDKLKLILDLFDKLKYNVSAKNVFHELILKFV